MDEADSAYLGGHGQAGEALPRARAGTAGANRPGVPGSAGPVSAGCRR
ncbi:hypothetical protein NY78_0826 [Desulfovibrio sp. TomC]|nr:hypothetical protein NY78_0826 [Desulfovibrio sp. TomC]